MKARHPVLEVKVWEDGTNICLSNPYDGDMVLIDPTKLCALWRQMQEAKSKIMLTTTKGKERKDND